ncbi:hypothetical protein LguiA_005158 [Lonicera macranthoides]
MSMITAPYLWVIILSTYLRASLDSESTCPTSTMSQRTLPFRRVHSAPPSVGALPRDLSETRQDQPIEGNNVDDPQGVVGAVWIVYLRPLYVPFLAIWGRIVRFYTFLNGHFLERFTAQEAEEDHHHPSSPPTFLGQEAEEDYRHPSSPLADSLPPEVSPPPDSDITFPGQEAEEDYRHPSSPLADSLPPEVSPPLDSDITFPGQEAEEDYRHPSSPLADSLPPEVSPPPDSDITYTNEIEPATPSISSINISSTSSTPVIPPYIHAEHINYIAATKWMVIFGGLAIGYAFDVMGGVIAMDLFVIDLSHHIYHNIKKAFQSNFCKYTNAVLLLFDVLIRLFSLIFFLVSFKIYNKWGRRKHILWTELALLAIGLGLILKNPNACLITIGMALTGAGLGIIHRSLLRAEFHFHVTKRLHLHNSDAGFALAMVLLFALGHSFLYGPHKWITERFPTEAQDLGSILGPTLSSCTALLMQISSLFLLCYLGDYTFIYLASICTVVWLFIYVFVPETTGILDSEIVEKWLGGTVYLDLPAVLFALQSLGAALRCCNKTSLWQTTFSVSLVTNDEPLPDHGRKRHTEVVNLRSMKSLSGFASGTVCFTEAYTLQRHMTINAAADFRVGSDDGHEELLAAANAVITPSTAYLQIWYTNFRNATLNMRIPKQETRFGFSVFAFNVLLVLAHHKLYSKDDESSYERRRQ